MPGSVHLKNHPRLKRLYLEALNRPTLRRAPGRAGGNRSGGAAEHGDYGQGPLCTLKNLSRLQVLNLSENEITDDVWRSSKG